MKNFFFLILIPVTFSAQMGINTNKPQQLLHIDGAKDNKQLPLSSAMIDNDVVVTNTGRMGIGEISPNVKMDIKSLSFGQGFRLADGTEGDGKMLTSINSTGDANWKTRLQTKVVLSDGGGFNGKISSDMAYINRQVDLEPGRWFINTTLLLSTNTSGTKDKGFYARFSWAEKKADGTYIMSPDALYGNELGGPYVYNFGIAKGNTLIENTSSSKKTYYLVTKTPIFWGGYDPNNTWYWLGYSFWGETTIIAFPAN